MERGGPAVVVAVVVVLCTFWSRGHALRVISCTEEEGRAGGVVGGLGRPKWLAWLPPPFLFLFPFSFFFFCRNEKRRKGIEILGLFNSEIFLLNCKTSEHKNVLLCFQNFQNRPIVLNWTFEFQIGFYK